MTRIGVFGGTFDPPHIGHLIIAEQACQQLCLDRLLFIPAYVPPHKRHKETANAEQRLAMVKLSIAGAAKFEVAAIEIHRKGISYTVDTLKELHHRNPKAKLFLIVGGDNYAGFKSWKSTGEILKLSSVVVYRRNLRKPLEKGLRLKNVKYLEGPFLDISSTMIREKVNRGESIQYLVLERVREFIYRHRMYLRNRD